MELTYTQVIEALEQGKGPEIGKAANEGSFEAARVVGAYQLLYVCPDDPVAQAMLVCTYQAYLQSTGGE